MFMHVHDNARNRSIGAYFLKLSVICAFCFRKNTKMKPRDEIAERVVRVVQVDSAINCISALYFRKNETRPWRDAKRASAEVEVPDIAVDLIFAFSPSDKMWRYKRHVDKIANQCQIDASDDKSFTFRFGKNMRESCKKSMCGGDRWISIKITRALITALVNPRGDEVIISL